MTVIETKCDTPVSKEGDGDGVGRGVQVPQKSAMALMTELTRFHGIKHEYRLCEESGPPHEKTFHVELQVGEEEIFRGSGRSIRKAYHAAAQSALDGTALAAPDTKARKSQPKKNASSTPTVELNVLAMKRGLAVQYDVQDPQNILPVAHFDIALLYDYRHNPHQRHHFKKTPYSATLTVGDMKFEGTGMTPQGARHTAADKALRVLRQSPADQTTHVSNQDKSPISVIHEMAVKKGCTVQFELVTESGPTHMPNFVIRCVLGQDSCIGQGNSKKQAKKKAAEALVRKLEQQEDGSCGSVASGGGDQVTQDIENKIESAVESHSDEKSVAPANQTTYQPMRDLISPSISISEDDKDHPVHPVNQLSILVRSQRKEEPNYLLIYERCLNKKRKEFVVQCTVRDPGIALLTAVGIDPIRKVAKKKAAEAMMQLIVTGRSSPEICLPPKPSHPPILKDTQNRQSDNAVRRERKVSFSDKSVDKGNKRAIVDKTEIKQISKSIRNIAPGVLIVQKDQLN